MKVRLMFRDRDLELPATPPQGEEQLMRDLAQDLELETVVEAMAGQDDIIREVAENALLSGLRGMEAVRYRQAVFSDCVRNRSVVMDLYNLAIAAIERRKNEHLGAFSRYHTSSILSGSVRLLRGLMDMLEELLRTATDHASAFHSGGFKTFFATLRAELGNDYLAEARKQLGFVGSRSRTFMSAGLGDGNKGTDYVLRRSGPRRNWFRRITGQAPRSYSFRVSDRDDSGNRVLGEMRDLATNDVANALAQSADHVAGFFSHLRAELGFYVGCLNLLDRIHDLGHDVCTPVPLDPGSLTREAQQLYDLPLLLATEEPVVGNDVSASGTPFVFITGANQGGKSTFLRSIGVAQLMMQAGMFVTAASFRASISAGVFTHFGREEDRCMESGRLDEELARMSGIADQLRPYALVLFNESFSATNEREGSRIASQIVSALADSSVSVFFVTHLYELARGFYDETPRRGTFLRAERRDDGTRTFRVIPGEPLQTSYGEDLYQEVFGVSPAAPIYP